VVLLERLLGAAGVGRVHGFTDPRLAFAHCTSALPDLVLLDLHMPEMDGFAFMEALQILLPTGGFLPILVLTADATTDVKKRALSSGAKDFLTKPFDRTEVLMRVANLLETRALYRRLEEHNVTLQAELDVRIAVEREAAAEDERRIDRALAPGALAVVFQPVADLTTGEVVGVEAQTRFLCEPHRSFAEWFAEADRVGRGPELELTAISAALDQLDLLSPEMFMAVNVSPATAVSPELDVLLARHPHDRIVLQLAEHAQIDDYDTLRTALDPFRDRGGRIAADDTGAGFASFEHLSQLSPHIIKLDIALSRGIEADPARRALATALVTFASEIDATIIAKEIQTPGELAALQRIGIPWGQGDHLARTGALPLSHRALGHVGTPSP
jgi:EAL domain-containing protein (putative c-di-GMP-specific phosphodiesterase class I)/AmiR/NasT family two-component response regulator